MGALAGVGIEDALAQADVERGGYDEFVGIDVLDGAFEGEAQRWGELGGFVLAGGAHVVEVLFLDGVDRKVADPWVFADPAGNGWHMLVTARANEGDDADRGVIAHATSPDLQRWTVRPPLSTPGTGFAHLEVPQIATIDSRSLLIFSCDSAALAGHRAGDKGGIWALEVDSPAGPYDISTSTLVAGDELYSGRLIRDHSGQWVMLAFENRTTGGTFVGELSDPMPVAWGADGLVAKTRSGELA